jgi:hypothetical protein
LRPVTPPTYGPATSSALPPAADLAERNHAATQNPWLTQRDGSRKTFSGTPRPDRRIGARRGADDGAAPAAHIVLIATYAAKRPAVTPKILETFFWVEDKRAMRTRIFQDLLMHAAFGRNVHVCAAQLRVEVQDPAFSLNISHGRSVRARRFRGAEEPSRKRLRIRASAFPKYRLCADCAFQECA